MVAPTVFPVLKPPGTHNPQLDRLKVESLLIHVEEVQSATHLLLVTTLCAVHLASIHGRFSNTTGWKLLAK
jgi:hypothetical protein